MQARISGTIDPELRNFLDEFTKNYQVTLSQALEKGIELLKQKSYQESMKNGYLADNPEALNWATESLKITSINNEKS